MRKLLPLLLLIGFTTACATTGPTTTTVTPTPPNVPTFKLGCPKQYTTYVSQRGQACWPVGKVFSYDDACVPVSGVDGYLFWSCPEFVGVAITRQMEPCEYVSFTNYGEQAIYAGCCRMKHIPRNRKSGDQFYCRGREPFTLQIRTNQPKTNAAQELLSECTVRIKWDLLPRDVSNFIPTSSVETRLVGWQTLAKAGVVCVEAD